MKGPKLITINDCRNCEYLAIDGVLNKCKKLNAVLNTYLTITKYSFINPNQNSEVIIQASDDCPYLENNSKNIIDVRFW